MSSVLKIFEKLVAAQVTNFPLDNHHLFATQFGFRKGLSCQIALIKLINFLLDARRNNLFGNIVPIDFRTTFDLLSHEMLFEALKQHNFDAAAIEWYRSYLNGRSQRIKCNDVFSTSMRITLGVPQGSILGPILCNIYINTLLQTVPISTAIAYADDLTLVVSGASQNDAERNMQALLDQVFLGSAEFHLSPQY